MKRISQEVIDGTLDAYPRPGLRYLKEAEIDYPNARARFVLEERELKRAPDHIMDVEIARCLTQFCYVCFGHIISEGESEVFGDLSLEEYWEAMGDRLTIKGTKTINYRGKIQETDFFGDFEFRGMSVHEDVHFRGSDYRTYNAAFDFSLDDGKCTGHARFVFYLENKPVERHVI